jgi:hypothetical protein
MSNVERLLHASGEPVTSHGEARGGVTAAEWLRHLERAQWAGLGEGYDRNAPTSAAEARGAGRPGHDEGAQGASPGALAAIAAAGAIAQVPGAPAPSPGTGLPPGDGPGSSRAAPSEPGTGAPAVRAEPKIQEASSTMPATPQPSPADAAQRHASEIGAIPGSQRAAPVARFTPGSDPRVPAGKDAASGTAQVRGAIEQRPASGSGAVEGEEPASTPLPRPAAPRSIRVFADSDGARIVVRDAALDAPGAQALVARIAAELALGGTRLVEVTVNGAKVFEAARQGAASGGIRAMPPSENGEQER